MQARLLRPTVDGLSAMESVRFVIMFPVGLAQRLVCRFIITDLGVA
jgi:hypothetical protein